MPDAESGGPARYIRPGRGRDPGEGPGRSGRTARVAARALDRGRARRAQGGGGARRRRSRVRAGDARAVLRRPRAGRAGRARRHDIRRRLRSGEPAALPRAVQGASARRRRRRRAAGAAQSRRGGCGGRRARRHRRVRGAVRARSERGRPRGRRRRRRAPRILDARVLAFVSAFVLGARRGELAFARHGGGDVPGAEPVRGRGNSRDAADRRRGGVPGRLVRGARAAALGAPGAAAGRPGAHAGGVRARGRPSRRGGALERQPAGFAGGERRGGFGGGGFEVLGGWRGRRGRAGVRAYAAGVDGGDQSALRPGRTERSRGVASRGDAVGGEKGRGRANRGTRGWPREAQRREQAPRRRARGVQRRRGGVRARARRDARRTCFGSWTPPA